ncbi:hypothetical protein HFD88_000397 [Aspergillus terreus]|nr:hypothetical protein HFD88_000397 [Aspergillus terreus]
MSFPYKHILLIGATSGIGLAMADRFVETGVKVTAVGRRQDRLDAFVQKHGSAAADAAAFDISKVDEIPQFVADVTTKSPDIDCVFLNAGVQRMTDLTSQDKWDEKTFDEVMHVNFTCIVALTRAFLPFLQAQKGPTSFIFTGSNLAIVPAAVMPAYSASKAALNAFVLCLREQLRESTVKIIELSPPAVQTELHDYMGVEVGRNLGMPLDQFVTEAYQGLQSGLDQVIVGTIGPAEPFYDIVNKRRTVFENLAKMMRR